MTPNRGPVAEAALQDSLTKLRAKNERLREALREYADPMNWGYLDDSGCPKGNGQYTDACFIGPDVARAALKEDA